MTTTPLPILPSASCGGVLIASPSPLLREQVLQSLDDAGCPVHQARGGAEALVKLEDGDWQILFLDRRLPDLDAEELMQIIRARFPGIQVVLLDSDSGQPLAPVPAELVRGPRSGPAATHASERLMPVVHSFRPAAAAEPLPGMIGTAEPMQRLYRMVRLVAPRGTTVLLVGETGTGKELVASALHKLSPRAARAYVIVNCAAIPEALLNPSCSATCAAHSPGQFNLIWGAFRPQAEARCFSMRSANYPSACRPNCCVSSSRERSSAWAARKRQESTCE